MSSGVGFAPAVLALVVMTVLAVGGCGGHSPPRTVAQCVPSPRHPEPVVLVPGTLVETTWNVVGPALARRGYCVYRFAYRRSGTTEIGQSARRLARFIDAVLARTHAKKVSIVGHSQGGMMPRYYIKFLGGADKVDDLVGLAPSNHGTLNPAIAATPDCVACLEQLWGSGFLERLNRGAETVGPVDYTVVETVDDLVLVPYTSAFLRGPRSRVTNVTLQYACPLDYVSHLGLPSDPVALQWIENALARPGPADPRFNPTC